jgi:hypothetical protein
MKTYLVEILRDSLGDFQERVRDEEAGASKFIDNQLATLDGKLTNLSTFERLKAGQLPDLPTFAEIGAVAGAPLWTGVVLVGAKTLAVTLHRSAGAKP